VSWGLASLLGLTLALGAGFAWYERSRPSARLLAVVGTLAALAILGRVAFAAVPNVKPTTDIVLIAGYALGGAPGFAVGAVAALGSNLFFGQGPWTPWQMAAWGLVGILGAVLARASGRRLGRVPMAVACGLAGLGFGAVMDLSTWVTYTGEHTLGQYLAIAATSLPFNVAHAVGNVVFFLAFGPGLVRAVERCRARFAIVWRPLGAAAVVLAALAVAAGTPALARAADTPAARALAYLRHARNADGGWGGAPGEASNGLHTAWAAYALAAGGVDPDGLAPPTSPVLVARLDGSHDLGDVERTILALRSCGRDPRDAGGRDLIAELRAHRRRDGSFGGYTSYTAYAILALRASAERAGIASAARWLARQANHDGGFNVYRRGGPSNADDTGYAIEALVAAGRTRGTAVRNAVAFLRRAQRSDGGYPLSTGAPTNAQSTAFAAMGLDAAGVDPERVRRDGRSPLAYLRGLQGADGSVRYSRSSRQTPVWVTAQALVALRHAHQPIAAPRAPPTTRRSSPASLLGSLAGALFAALLRS
jgi:energy-coupling factor transport system substrate-specific component